MSFLNSYMQKKICVVTADGRTLVGTLVSADQTTNLVMSTTVERVIRSHEDTDPSAEVPLGLYIVRGDNVCTVGLVDEALDDSIDWSKVKGEVIGGIKHS